MAFLILKCISKNIQVPLADQINSLAHSIPLLIPEKSTFSLISWRSSVKISPIPVGRNYWISVET